VVACLSQLYSRAADEALLVALLSRRLLELHLFFVLLALVAQAEQGLALDACQRAAVFALADGVRDLRSRVLDM
jgi:hypothetical protein